MCTSLAGDLYAVNGRESMVEVAPVRLETLRGGGIQVGTSGLALRTEEPSPFPSATGVQGVSGINARLPLVVGLSGARRNLQAPTPYRS